MQQHAPQQLRTGTDRLPILNQVAQVGQGGTPQQNYESLNTPSVWRSPRAQAAAKVDALASNGMDEIEITAFFAEAGRLTSECCANPGRCVGAGR